MKILVLFMGRSGGHAVVRWIANGLEGTVMFHSNCINGWKDKKLEPNKIVTEKADEYGEEIHTIKSIEDFHLPLWYELKGFETFDKVIAVIRSPRNWLASSIAIGGWANDYLTKAPKDCRRLPVSRIEAYKYYYTMGIIYGLDGVLNYDKWVTDKEYRYQLAQDLNIECTPLPEQCKFSSFRRPYDHTGDRTKYLKPKQKKRFEKLYDKELQEMQESLWKK